MLNLCDSYCLTLPSLYISTLILSLRTMLQMDLPHLNVLTKIDKLHSYGPLAFNLDYYTDVQDLSYLLPRLEEESSVMHKKFEGLNTAIVDLVESFGLVSYETLAVEDKKSMMALLQSIDRAGGYAFGSAEGANDTVWQVAMRGSGTTVMDVKDVQERWLDAKDEYDEIDRAAREAQDEQMRGVPEGDEPLPADSDDDLHDLGPERITHVRKR